MFVRLVTTPAVVQNCWAPPIGIAQLAGSLKSIGVSTHCLDLNPEFGYGGWIPTEIIGFEPEIEGADLLRRIWPGIVAKWATLCLEGKPDLIGMSVLTAGMVVPSLALACEIKSINPGIPICFGGPFAVPSNYKLIDRLLQTEVIDGIVQGDGELSIRRIISAINQKTSLVDIPGMWTKKGARSVINVPPELVNPNDLPLADFHDFHIEKYKNNWHGYFPIFGSRGCVNKCSFCNSRKMCPHFFQRSAAHIFEEIQRNVSLYGITKLAFTDNLINGNPRELKKLCKMIIQAKLNIEIWGSVALMPSADEEMLDLLQEAGFKDILLALESPAPKVRKDMGKWQDIKNVAKIIRGVVKRSMKPCIYLMHSFPTERDEDFEQLLHFVDDFSPSDFLVVAYWPFRLAQVQPGEIDMDFVKNFGLKLESGYGLDLHDSRVAFGKEPKWSTEYVNDSIKIERQYRLDNHIAKWHAQNAIPQQPEAIKNKGISGFIKRNIRKILRSSGYDIRRISTEM